MPVAVAAGVRRAQIRNTDVIAVISHHRKSVTRSPASTPPMAEPA